MESKLGAIPGAVRSWYSEIKRGYNYDIGKYRWNCLTETGHFKRVSMGWWLLRLSAKVLALFRLLGNFFQLRLTKKLKNNFYCFKKFNINKPIFFVSLKYDKVLAISDRLSKTPELSLPKTYSWNL